MLLSSCLTNFKLLNFFLNIYLFNYRIAFSYNCTELNLIYEIFCGRKAIKKCGWVSVNCWMVVDITITIYDTDIIPVISELTAKCEWHGWIQKNGSLANSMTVLRVWLDLLWPLSDLRWLFIAFLFSLCLYSFCPIHFFTALLFLCLFLPLSCFFSFPLLVILLQLFYQCFILPFLLIVTTIYT